MSAAPIVVQEFAPCTERWNRTDATPESASAESDDTVTTSRTAVFAGGDVTSPVGGVLSGSSTLTESLSSLVAVQVWKYATTCHSHAPSPGMSEQLVVVRWTTESVPQTPVQSSVPARRRSIV